MSKRPPKKWFDRMIKRLEGADDPAALTGWIWHHHLTAKQCARIKRAEYDPDQEKGGENMAEKIMERREHLLDMLQEIEDEAWIATREARMYRYDTARTHLDMIAAYLRKAEKALEGMPKRRWEHE